jgi:DnaJ-class molecular chaperone
VRVPTPTGPVTLTIPKGSNTGRSLRLRGKGVPDPRTGKRGDMFARLKVVLPERPDPELEGLVESWAAKHPYDPRRGMAEG